jgi:hypothetical protein
MALLLAACNKPYDDSSILERVASLENRVSTLETAVQSIQSAVGDGIFVQKVEEYADPTTGKTVGVTVTYTSGKVVFFEISPKADYSGPVLSVITSGSGQLVWAVDGIPLKYNGEEVTVYQTPVFTIDSEGNLLVSIDGSDPVVIGKVTNEGATLQDGIFKDIKVEADKVVLVLSDDTVVNIPFAAAFELKIEQTEFVYSEAGTIAIPYTVTAATANTVVGVTGYSQKDFFVAVDDQKIEITPLRADATGTLMAYADSKVGLTSIVSIVVEPEGAFVTDASQEGPYDYIADPEDASVVMHVVSNVDFDVVPGESWIHVAAVKGKVYAITLQIDDNPEETTRSGEVVITRKGNPEAVLQKVTIGQLGELPGGVKDLSKKASANSYIVKAAGDFKFKAVKGNSDESVGSVAKAEILWETWNNAEAVAANSVIAKVGFEDGYVTFSTPETIKPGNAVIAAKDAAGTILWSWHIWVPASTIVTLDYGIIGAPMMDRNLGALVAAVSGEEAPVESFGLTYQWGRKDPFVGPKAANSSDNATVAGVALSSTEGAGEADECKITLEQSIQNPTLLGHAKNGDWLTPADNTLWQNDVKTIYDPCPPGYRVPARDKSQYFHSGDLSKAPGWAENKSQFWFALGDPLAVFPFAGYRDDYDPSGMTHAYDRAAYWTAYSSADAKGYYVNVRAGSAHALAEAGKSRAGSVRCVTE